MKKIFNLFITFVLVLTLYSCQEDEKIVIPAVEIAAANANATSLSFYIAHAGATSGAFLCQPVEYPLPATASEVLEKGISMDMRTQEIVVKGLESNTAYNIVVAVENKHRSAISNSINMKTTILVPSIISVRESNVSLTSLSFNIEYKNATSGAYLCIPKGKIVPTDASEIISNGTPITISGGATSVTIEELEPGTEYTILVAVANEFASRMYPPFTITLPAADKPIISINPKEITNHSFSFYTSVTSAQEASWMVLPAKEKVPSTETIIQEGTTLNTEGKEVEIVVDDLEQGMEYILYIAAKNYNQTAKESHKFKILKGDFMTEFDIATYKTYNNTNRELVLYDGSIEAPDYKLTLDLHFNADNSIIPAGNYEVKGGTMYGTICTWYSKFEIAEENANFGLVSGTVNVSATKKGVYTFDIDISLKDGRNLATTFTGTITEE